MADTKEKDEVSKQLSLIIDRLSALEALVHNIYSKYYVEHYKSPDVKAFESLSRVKDGNYFVLSDYCGVDSKHGERVRCLISDFFNNLSLNMTAITMNRKVLNYPVTFGANKPSQINQGTELKHKIEALIHAKIPLFVNFKIVQMYTIAPASDLVLRVWLQDKFNEKRTLSLVVKMLGDNPVRNDIVDKYGLFYREASFYASLSNPISQFVPDCHYSSVDDSILILEDLGSSVMGDQLHGYYEEEALSVIRKLADFHVHWFGKAPEVYLPKVNDPQITSMIPDMLSNAWQMTREHLNAKGLHFIDAIIEEVCDQVIPITNALAEHSTVIHGDLRMENILFNKMRATAIIDWQLLAIGSPMIDVANFLVQSGNAQRRKKVESDIINLYATKLKNFSITHEQLWSHYQLATKYNIIIPIMGAAWDLQNEDKPRAIVQSAFDRTIEAISEH